MRAPGRGRLHQSGGSSGHEPSYCAAIASSNGVTSGTGTPIMFNGVLRLGQQPVMNEQLAEGIIAGTATPSVLNSIPVVVSNR